MFLLLEAGACPGGSKGLEQEARAGVHLRREARIVVPSPPQSRSRSRKQTGPEQEARAGSPNIDIWVPKMSFSKRYIFGAPFKSEGPGMVSS